MAKKVSSDDILKLAQDSIFRFGRDDGLVSDRIIQLAHDDVYWPIIQNLNKLLAEARTQAQQPQEARTPISEISTPTHTKVRRNSLGTSWEAAYAQTPEKSRKLYIAIYRVLNARGPLTDEELHDLLRRLNFPHTVSGLRARRSELATAGWVKASGDKKPSENGVPMTLWEAVPE